MCAAPVQMYTSLVWDHTNVLPIRLFLSYRSVSLMLGGKPEGISVTGEDDTKVWKSDIKAVKIAP
jgi:hypothetical protein